MGLNEVRQKYIEYYKQKDHLEVPSYSLLPENDPTTLFINSGMQPMLQYFLGEPHPSGNSRIVDSQKCIRAVDIEEVGNNRHTTCFEMLGNWSLGDYWKKEQLRWLFELLIDELGLDLNRLYVTTFSGDEKNGLPRDQDSVDIWIELFKEKGIEANAVDIGREENGAKLGINRGDKIFSYDATKNWWSRQGAPGNMPIGEPGGPDSELFYEYDDIEHDPAYGEKCHPNCDCGRFVEIGNSVFMEYKKIAEGIFEPLPNKNVDFGGGLERLTAAINDFSDIFKIDVYANIIKILEIETGIKYEGENKPSMRIIADHIKGATFLISEGLHPGNKQQEYILRRLIRRSAVKFYELTGNVEASEVFGKIVESYIEYYGERYFDQSQKEEITLVLKDEIKKFGKSLDKGFKVLNKVTESELNAKFAFDLYQTHGFPFEITQELFAKKGIELSAQEYNYAKEAHKEASRTASAGRFKGGLGDDSEKTVWYHTLTHLLHQALRDVLGDHVSQAGSNITPERLRFDFKHNFALTMEERVEVEKIVNEKLIQNLEITMETLPLQKALNLGVMAFFKEKYGDQVNVYSIGDYSKEICGGPHVKNTSEIKGAFKIVKEKSNGAGIRRIRAVLE